jgi:hypothetical protein
MPKNPDELYSEIVLRTLQASEALIMFAAVMEIGLKFEDWLSGYH